MNPIPHGFPGVASSMNLPNSGWNVGAGRPCLHQSVCYPDVYESLLLLRIAFIQLRDTATLCDELRVVRESLQDIGLSKRELHVAVHIVESDDQILNLQTSQQ